LVEVIHPRISRPAFDWAISRLPVEPVTAEIARQAGVLLEQAGRHGDQYVIDAMLAATALSAPGPTTVLTSDPDDIAMLCGHRVTVVKV
jgi:predicted nucleic acid-binding protein